MREKVVCKKRDRVERGRGKKKKNVRLILGEYVQ